MTVPLRLASRYNCAPRPSDAVHPPGRRNMTRALQAPIRLIASLLLISISIAPTLAFAADKYRPAGTPILSGTNLDLVDLVESGAVYSATASDPYVYAAFERFLVVLDVSD